MRLLYLALAVVALAAPPAALSYSSPNHLNEVASWLAGKDVTVHCLGPGEAKLDSIISVWGAAAYVEIRVDPFGQDYPADYTVVAPPYCEALMDMALDGDLDRHSFETFVWSVMIITHESGHLRGKAFPGWKSESEVNCWALRRSAAVAQLEFGLNPNLVPQFKAELWKFFTHQPKAYRKSSCTMLSLTPEG